MELPPPLVIVEEVGARPNPDPALPNIAWTRGTPAALWSPSALPIGFTPSAPFSGDLSSELAVAARTWSEVACTSFRARVLEPAALAPANDGINGVFLHTDAWPPELEPGALGQTVLHVDPQGNLQDADIHLNGVDWRFSVDGAGDSLDVRGVLLHEMGHALGLGHTPDPRATMHASHPPGLAWRSLEADDRAGVCALYPGVGAPTCDVGERCSDGFVCVARACERRGARGEVCSPCVRLPGACDGAGDDARCNDLPTAAGRVCGRACTASDDCGPGFTCAPQTAAGDLQCVPSDGCGPGPDPCVQDVDCAGLTEGAVCREGACVGPPEGADAGPTTAADAGRTSTAGATDGGCAIARGAAGGSALSLALLALVAFLRAACPAR